jgi:hypothetical protein
MNFIFGKTFVTAYTETFGDVTALKPEWWALEGLAVLDETLVVANLVNKDFNEQVVNAGDTVNVHKPGTFTAQHKVRGESVTTQLASATGDTVKLNQHIEVSFNIDDRDLAVSMKDLRGMFLVPAIRAIAKGIDGALVGEGPGLAMNGAAGQLGTALTDDAVIALGRIFDENNVPEEDRNLVVGPAGKANLLAIDRFTDLANTGYSGNSIITGRIGEVMGFNVYMSQTVGSPVVAGTGMKADTFTTNGTASKGAQSVTVDGGTAAAAKGQFITIAGTDGIYALTAAADATATSLSIYPALQSDVANDKAVTLWAKPGKVKGDTASGAIKVITDGYASAAVIPKVGQAVTFGTDLSESTAPKIYTVTKVTGTWADSTTEITLTLNRPLDAAASNDVDVNLGPVNGSYNMAFRPDAITLVNRPLAPAAAGVLASTQSSENFALRVTIGYDQSVMMHKITVDTLLGVKTLDPDQGAILFC